MSCNEPAHCRQSASLPPEDAGHALNLSSGNHFSVLFVCSGNPVFTPGHFDFVIDQAAVHEQMTSLRAQGIPVDIFFIRGHGAIGYLKNLRPLKEKILSGRHTLVHAHYGLAGLLAVCQRLAPVVVTFQGTDINYRKFRYLSVAAAWGAVWSVFVSDALGRALPWKPKRSCCIPYGVDLELFHLQDKVSARQTLGLRPDGKYVLFASSFSFPVKNAGLAQSAATLAGDGVMLLDLRGRSRQEVCLLLNACDALLMTSRSEGSPQIIKEALACNCPIVATRVGDVPELIDGVAGCFLADSNPRDVAGKLMMALAFTGRTNGRERVAALDLTSIARRLTAVYEQVLRRKNCRVQPGTGPQTRTPER